MFNLIQQTTSVKMV
uniref:Uncharacterized protein n=1 Tax=Anguilla anguilla TaxID=7936 RepID=A0A0E9XR97_ANGAN